MGALVCVGIDSGLTKTKIRPIVDKVQLPFESDVGVLDTL